MKLSSAVWFRMIFLELYTADRLSLSEFKFPFSISGPPISIPLEPWPSEPGSDDITDPLDWPEAKAMRVKHTSDPFKFPETDRLLAANPNMKRVRVGLKSALVQNAFKPGLCAQAA